MLRKLKEQKTILPIWEVTKVNSPLKYRNKPDVEITIYRDRIKLPFMLSLFRKHVFEPPVNWDWNDKCKYCGKTFQYSRVHSFLLHCLPINLAVCKSKKAPFMAANEIYQGLRRYFHVYILRKDTGGVHGDWSGIFFGIDCEYEEPYRINSIKDEAFTSVQKSIDPSTITYKII